MTGGSVMVNHGRGLQVASLGCFGDSVFTRCLQKPWLQAIALFDSRGNQFLGICSSSSDSSEYEVCKIPEVHGWRSARSQFRWARGKSA